MKVQRAGLVFLMALFVALGGCSAPPPEADDGPRFSFREQVIEPELGIGYGVVIADVNADSQPDVVAINETQVMWFENPSWQKHVVSEGVSAPDNVCLAAHDVDGDGRLDIALGADWQPRNTEGGGTIQWVRQGDDPTGGWSFHAIGAEPTTHRMRWGDVDGDGARELLVAPLQGRGTSPPAWWEGAGARMLVLRPPEDATKPDWREEVADDTIHMMHNFWVTNFDADAADELITAGYEGVHVLDRGPDGAWSRRRLGEGYQEGDGDKGAGEVKLGRLANGRRYLATVEPWHANHLVVYLEGASSDEPWERKVLLDQLGGGHALWTADLDGDGDEELVFGWRQEGGGEFQKTGVGVFDPGEWNHYEIIDSGGMATEDVTAADLNGDGRPEVIAAGRATHNLKIYWNERE